jgi:hypothetical protein
MQRKWSIRPVSSRILTHAELEDVTGLSQRNKQAEWFREAFAITVVRRNDGLPVMTWDTLERLLARQYGLALESKMELRPALRPVFPDRK